MIGRGCVEARDETASAWSREEVQGLRYLDGSSNIVMRQARMGMADGQPGSDEGWVGRRGVIRWYGMEEELRKGSSLVRSFQGLEEADDNGGDGRPRCVRNGWPMGTSMRKERRNGSKIGSRAGR